MPHIEGAPDDALASIVRNELGRFREALLLDVEKVVVRAISQGTMNRQESTGSEHRVASSGESEACEEYSVEAADEQHYESKVKSSGQLGFDVLAEVAEDAKDFAEELENVHHHDKDHSSIVKEFKQCHDDSFASTFLNNINEDGNLDTPHYFVEQKYSTTGIAQNIARRDSFINFILAVVMVNAVYIGFAMDLNKSAKLYEAHWFFIVAENTFCAVFVIEIIIRYVAFAKTCSSFRDGWFRFDFALVLLGVSELWILTPFLAGKDSIKLPLGPFRMLRFLKMIRMARLMSCVPELVTMAKGMLLASRAVLSSMMMIFFLNYAFAILLHVMLSDDVEMNEILYKTDKRDFSTVPDCMWTLFMDATLMASCDTVLTELIRAASVAHVIACIVFILYMLLSSVVIMNMLIGCLCEVVSNVEREREEEEAIRLMKQSILVDLKKYDNGDGMLTRKELNAVLTTAQSKAILQSLQIDRLFLLQLQSMLFINPDTQVSIQAIMQLMLSCRGTLSVTVLHFARGQAFISTLVAAFEKRIMSTIHERLPKPIPRGGRKPRKSPPIIHATYLKDAKATTNEDAKDTTNEEPGLSL